MVPVQQASLCPRCGGTTPLNARQCPFCGVYLHRASSSFPSDAEESFLAVLLLGEHDSENFLTGLVLHCQNRFGQGYLHTEPTSLSKPQLRQAMVLHENVVDWLEANESELPVHPVLGSALTTVQRYLQEMRQRFVHYLQNGWPEYFVEKIGEFPAEYRNDLLDVLKLYIQAPNENVSGSMKAMTTGDQLISMLFGIEEIAQVAKRIYDRDQIPFYNLPKTPTNIAYVSGRNQDTPQPFTKKRKPWWRRLF